VCRADAIFHVEQLKNCRAVEIRAVAIQAVDPDSIICLKKRYVKSKFVDILLDIVIKIVGRGFIMFNKNTGGMTFFINKFSGNFHVGMLFTPHTPCLQP
jgi:hypothetical protein